MEHIPLTSPPHLPLRAAMRRAKAEVRAAAVRALVALGPRSELAAALRNPAAAVRYAGLQALGRSTRELCRSDARRL